MELLNQLDGFEQLGQVKMVMVTNRSDILDPALLRPGRLDRKIEIPLPSEAARLDILKIHAMPITKRGGVEYESVCKLADGFNDADLWNVYTEAGLFAIRSDRDYAPEADFMKAAREIADVEKLESKASYDESQALKRHIRAWTAQSAAGSRHRASDGGRCGREHHRGIARAATATTGVRVAPLTLRTAFRKPAP